MARTSYGSDDIATSLIRAVARRRMYNLPQLDARFNWFVARIMPETFRKLMLFLYRRRLWVFNDG